MHKSMRAAPILAAAALWACGSTHAPIPPPTTTGGGTGPATTGTPNRSGPIIRGTTGAIGGPIGRAGIGGSTGSGSTTGASSGGATTGPGPWPNQALTQYGAAQGLSEPIVDVSTDEAENIWAVSSDALYLLQPGQSQFHRYTDADGLHISNAASPGIMNVAGGKPGEVFVGYNGADWNGPGDPQITGDPSHDAILKEGGIDHVQLNANGTLTVVHPDVHSNDYYVSYPDGGSDSDFSYMEDRGTRRMLYDHYFHDGTLYVGWNHGVGRFDWGKPDSNTGEMFGDHVHPTVYSYDAQGNPTTEWMGEWRGLALDPTQNGMLWMGGQYTGGAINWTPKLYVWTCTTDSATRCPEGSNTFVHAWAMKWGAPLFPVAKDGDSMNIRAAAVTSDGTAYFASGPEWNPGVDKMYGVAVVKKGGISYLDPVADLHLPSAYLMDMVAMPDDTLVFAVMGDGLYRYDPKTGQTTQIQGVPGNVNMLYLDKMVKPAALYAATDQGVSVVRDVTK